MYHLLVAPALAQAYGEGAYGECVYGSTALCELVNLIDLFPSGADLLWFIIAIFALGGAVGLFVWARRRRNRRRDTIPTSSS